MLREVGTLRQRRPGPFPRTSRDGPIAVTSEDSHVALIIADGERERKREVMDPLMDMESIIEELNANPDADLDGSTLHVNEQLEESGQVLWWDDEGETYIVGPLEED